jgi:hypothetical protein
MSISGITSGTSWYKTDQAWNKSRQGIAKQFLEAGEAVSSAFTGALNDQISGMATLSGRAALKRITGAIASGSTSSLATGNTSRYKYTSASSVLSNSNVVNFFA